MAPDPGRAAGTGRYMPRRPRMARSQPEPAERARPGGKGEAMTDHVTGAEVLAMDRAHVFHSWSAQKSLRPVAVARAEGTTFWDYDGKRYLDFSSQLV